MKKCIALLLIIVLLLSGCAKAPATEPQQEITPPPAAEPIVPQVAGLSERFYEFNYNDKRYSSFYTHYGYNYYSEKDMRLLPTGDTVDVTEILFDMPENTDYKSEPFSSEIFTIENDIYGGTFLFVYNKTRNIYYPFQRVEKSTITKGDSIKTAVDKQYGSGSFDTITEVRLCPYNYFNKWFELPDQTETELLKTVKNMCNTDNSWQCNHKSDDDRHCTLRLVLPTTKFEYQLTLCHKESKINGWKIPKELCDDIMSCIDTNHHREFEFVRYKTE